MEFEAEIIKKGNSLGFILPRNIVKEHNIKVNEKITLKILK